MGDNVTPFAVSVSALGTALEIAGCILVALFVIRWIRRIG
jgi:hypothetical protein